jgi:ubiquinone/menaquinone biosynthesis C-methylase UbiE
MGTPWDRAAARYLEEWVPRFVPYYLDLIGELTIGAGQRVLVPYAGPGGEVLAVARAVGEGGFVRATDESEELVAICAEQVRAAGFASVRSDRAPAADASGGPYNAVLCAFGFFRADDPRALLRAWASALAPKGKIGILTFGPREESDPFELLAAALHDLEPNAEAKPTRVDADRAAMTQMFESAGLSLVRLTVLRHTLSFPTAEDFTSAIREGRTWRAVFDEIGPDRTSKVLARFYDRVGGPTAPLGWEPAVTLAIAALPGAEVELLTRSSVKAPPLSTPPSQGRR